MTEERPCSLGYLVDAGSDWRIRSAHVFGTIGTELVDVFAALAEGRWHADGRPQAVPEGAHLDLGFTPAGVLCLLRRHPLAIGAQAEVDTVALRLGRAPVLEPVRHRIRRLSELDYAIDDEDGARWSAVRVDRQLCAVRVAGRWETEDGSAASRRGSSPRPRSSDVPGRLPSAPIHAAE